MDKGVLALDPWEVGRGREGGKPVAAERRGGVGGQEREETVPLERAAGVMGQGNRCGGEHIFMVRNGREP